MAAAAAPKPQPEDRLEYLYEQATTWNRLIRTTAYLFRVFNKDKPKQRVVDPEEHAKAEQYWIKRIQQEEMKDLIVSIERKKVARFGETFDSDTAAGVYYCKGDKTASWKSFWKPLRLP